MNRVISKKKQWFLTLGIATVSTLYASSQQRLLVQVPCVDVGDYCSLGIRNGSITSSTKGSECANGFPGNLYCVIRASDPETDCTYTCKFKTSLPNQPDSTDATIKVRKFSVTDYPGVDDEIVE